VTFTESLKKPPLLATGLRGSVVALGAFGADPSRLMVTFTGPVDPPALEAEQL
jgi:hypothetical protein